MFRLRLLNYRFAVEVLDSPAFAQAKNEIVEILENAPVPLLLVDKVKRRRRRPLREGSGLYRYFFLPTDQEALNRHLSGEFVRRDWEYQPLIVRGDAGHEQEPETRADFRKSRVQVEVQFGNMARWYADVFKFQVSYSEGIIDVGVLVVPTQMFANTIDENIAYFERIERELPFAKMSITLPILVLGLEPLDVTPIRAAYEEAGQAFAGRQMASGDPVEVIPWEDRIRERPVEEEEGAGNSE